MDSIYRLYQYFGASSLVYSTFFHLFFNSQRTSKWSLFLLLFLCLSKERPLLASESADQLWPLIETQLDQSELDTAHHFMLLIVRGHCGDNYSCLYPSYAVLREKLERRFDLSSAIIICNEMVRIAKAHGDLDGEAQAYMQLFRFYDALGEEEKAVVSMEKARLLYEKTSNQQAISQIRINKLENKLRHQSIEEVLPEMEALLKEVTAKKDTFSMNLLNLRLIHYSQSAGEYELMAKHVEAVENIPISTPIKAEEYGIVIYAAIGRADLARIDNDLDKAEQFYQKALRFCEAEPSRWLEIKTLQNLTEIEWERGRLDLAKSYLDSAQVKAEKLNLDDLLTYNFELKAKIAEEEGRYADALKHTKRKVFHEQKFNNKSAEFDAKNFFLQKEKEQLAAEKERQALELRFKDARVRNLIISIVLGLCLIAALGLGLVNQRLSKKKLAVKNNLIQKQAERLANLDAAKSRFFANISHELRTPLSLLLGPIGTLVKENKLNERQVKLLRIASESGHQLEQLVNEILDLGKMEMGKMGLDKKPTECYSFFRHYLMQFESLAYRKQIEFLFEVKVDKALIANIDQGKCRQVLYNLLSNAFKFTPKGGRINAGFLLENNNFVIEVKDSGPGIHPDDIPHLFDRYFQTNQVNKPAMGGSGIGLALCHEYAQLFGGKIEVESSIGEGAVFRFSFPVETVDGKEPDAGGTQLNQWKDIEIVEPVLEQPLLGDKELLLSSGVSLLKSDKPKIASVGSENLPTILLVEDNLELQDYIQMVLGNDYHVITAENGKAALQRLEERTDCQLIISDLMMPVMDGYQLLENLKSNDAFRHIPVVMLTARADTKDKLKALRLGVDDYLLKPFEEDELLARINNLLKNYQRRASMKLTLNQMTVPSEYVGGGVENGNAINEVFGEVQNKEPVLSAEDMEWLSELENNLQKELTQFDFKLEQLAESMFVSRRQLGRQVKALTGLTPSEYVLEARLQQARQLLNEKQVRTVKEAAYTVGLRDAKHFSKKFKLRFGKSPSEVLDRYKC